MILSAFYEAIMARLTTKISEIKHFDLYFGQYDVETEEGKNEASFPRPAVFFEYDPKDWQTLGNKKQESNAGFTLHVVSDVLQDVSNRETSTIRNKGHLHLQLQDKIFYYLQGFNGTGFGSISRTGDAPYSRAFEHQIVHLMHFRVRLQDTAGKVAMTHIPKADLTQEITGNMTDNDE